MSKIAIIGTGAVGSSIAYAVMIKGLVNELILVDQLSEKAMAEQLDLNHGAMYVPKTTIAHGDLNDAAGADILVVTAGTKLRPGQSPFDLAQANAQIFKNIIPAIVKAAPNALLLIVSNPVDALTEVARRLSGLSPERVFGAGTVLDTSRFRCLLGQFFGVAPSRVHAYIIGAAGEDEVPVWSSARIGNALLGELHLPHQPAFDARARQRLFQLIRENAATVIRYKGAPNWATGLAVVQILEALLRDERVVLTVSRLLHNYLDVEGLCLSAPHLVTGKGAEAAIPVPCDDEERRAFRHSAAPVKEMIAKLGC